MTITLKNLLLFFYFVDKRLIEIILRIKKQTFIPARINGINFLFGSPCSCQ